MTKARSLAQSEVYSQRSTRRFTSVVLLALLLILTASPKLLANGKRQHFRRIATFPVFLNTDVNLDTVAEIVAATGDGNLLVYTDSETENIGFVDISDSADPQANGVVAVAGEPTSVAVAGGYALAAVNTSTDFVNTSGLLQIIDIGSRAIVRDIGLGGQPDSIAVSPDGQYAVVVIENERDEDLGSGGPPQLPAGFAVIVSLNGDPSQWQTQDIVLTGIATLFPDDPEPEYVDINADNKAIISLQENNHLIIVDLASGTIDDHWNAGTVSLEGIDVLENDLIQLDGELLDLPREPDAVTWIGNGLIATADEGDLNGGSRGFTIFEADGSVAYSSRNSLERLTVRLGHYPEDRSENKGNEPEGVEFGSYGRDRFLFVGSERSSVIFVYRVQLRRERGDGHGLLARLQLVQVLPAGVGPEGLLAIPSRDLFVAAAEVDDRGAKIRSSITIYQLDRQHPTYPTILSANPRRRAPIAWGALSALAGDPIAPDTMYTAYDSFYRQSRIFQIDTRYPPARIRREIVLRDGDQTVDLDVEGLAIRSGGGFWVASEGSGSVDDPNRPVTSLNQLLEVADDGAILSTVELPAEVNALQRRFGFEGVATDSTDSRYVYVAIQREWVGDPSGMVRIGRYDTATGEWAFYYYPLETPTSPNGGWVGLSEILGLGNGRFAVIERDNQGGPDATIKRIYEFTVAGVTPQPQGSATPFPLLDKMLVRDLIPDLLSDNGFVIEKVEGLGVLSNGDAYIVTDNDGVDDSSGETQFIDLGSIFD